MIISDLQYLESVDASEVVGGRGRRRVIRVVSRRSADATADAFAQALGDRTETDSNSEALADSNDGFSQSSSNASASASTTRVSFVPVRRRYY